MSYEIAQGSGGDTHFLSDYGCVVFRGVEAMLNYMEACYEKNSNLDATAESYWKAIRTRAGVDPDFNKTIALLIILKKMTGLFIQQVSGR